MSRNWYPKWMMMIHFAFLANLLVGTALAADPQSTHSQLWGAHGERWTAESRLPDFSYAGYHRGERELPRLTADVSVKDFGAVGDGKTDDTDAFQTAIREAAGKTIAIPAGTYVITDMLEIRRSGTVLQGDGAEESVLKFPTPLNEIKPNWGATTSGKRTSNYSWSGGIISIVGAVSPDRLAKVTEPANRGATSLVVSSVGAFHVGDEIRLKMSDRDDQSLAKYLYANDPGPLKNLGRHASTVFIARITGIDEKSNQIEFDRALRTDVRLDWKPSIYAAGSSVEEVGIERLGFEFPQTPYEGHFSEQGFNAIAMSDVRHCWARDVKITNCDSGVFLRGTNITLEQIVLESERPVEPTRQATGHHGITLGGQDNLLTEFDYRTRFMHDITVTRGSTGNVAADGRGIDLCFDHHCYALHANLFTNIDLGEGTRMFQSGGGSALGRHSGAWETFWCIRSRRPQKWPKGWGPDLMNLVGVESNEPEVLDIDGRWFEPISPQRLQPANLYQAQLSARREADHHRLDGDPN